MTENCRDAWTEPRPAWPDRDSRRIEARDGVEIHVDICGDERDQTVVFVHGGGASRLAWDKQVEALEQQYHVVVPDLRGHGLSEKPTTPTRKGFDVVAVLNELGLDDAVLVAWSRGAVAVLDAVALAGTDRIRAINFVGAHPGVGKGLDPFIHEAFADLPEGLRGHERFVWALFSADPRPPEYHYFLAMRCRHEPDSHRRSFHGETLPQVDVPVLLTHGECDSVVLPRTLETFQAEIPRTETSTYEGIGHMPFWDAPERFNAELRAFVDDLAGT